MQQQHRPSNSQSNKQDPASSSPSLTSSSAASSKISTQQTRNAFNSSIASSSSSSSSSRRRGASLEGIDTITTTTTTEPPPANATTSITATATGAIPQPSKSNTTEVDNAAVVPDAQCFVCCETKSHFALLQCNHNSLCWLCVLRIRVLMKNHKCCICKEESANVIITAGQSNKRFSDYNLKSLFFDRIWKVHSTSLDIQDQIAKLRELRCSICSSSSSSSSSSIPNDLVFDTYRELSQHLRDIHGLFYCDLCMESRKMFLPEQKLYTREELKKHMKYGDPDDSECIIKGHPLCEFCNRRFYSDDELFRHMTIVHYTCHLCEAEGVLFQYHFDYNALENHFKKSHFLCEHTDCLEKKFIVFPTEVALRAHEALVHSTIKKKSGKFVPLDIPIGEPQLDNSSRSRPSTRSTRNAYVESSSIQFVSIDNVLLPNRNRHESDKSDSKRQENRRRLGPLRIPISQLPPLLQPPIVRETTQLQTPSLASASGTSSEQPQPQSQQQSQQPPLTLEDRNLLLISNMKAALKGDVNRFKEFRDTSVRFQKGEMLASEYYVKFMEYFGSDQNKALSLFSEMVDLLPDRNKRDALMMAYNVHHSKENGIQQQKQKKKKQKKKEDKSSADSAPQNATSSSSASSSSSSSSAPSAWLRAVSGSTTKNPTVKPALSSPEFPALQSASSSAPAASSVPQWPAPPPPQQPPPPPKPPREKKKRPASAAGTSSSSQSNSKKETQPGSYTEWLRRQQQQQPQRKRR